jgi:hypothetical protein
MTRQSIASKELLFRWMRGSSPRMTAQGRRHGPRGILAKRTQTLFWPNEAKVRRGSNGARRGDELRYAAIRDQSATEGMLACDISASLASR